MQDVAKRYPIVVMPLSDEDGGGFAARVPDLPGCFGDGKTAERAVRDAEKAILEWLDEYAKMGRAIPAPGSMAEAFRKQRETELNYLRECVERLREVEKHHENLEGHIAAIERELMTLTLGVEEQDDWERFQVIRKSTGRSLPDLFN